jgi:hypothetical protein
LFGGHIGFLANYVCAVSVPGLGYFSINYFIVIKKATTTKNKQTKNNNQKKKKKNKQKTQRNQWGEMSK